MQVLKGGKSFEFSLAGDTVIRNRCSRALVGARNEPEESEMVFIMKI